MKEALERKQSHDPGVEHSETRKERGPETHAAQWAECRCIGARPAAGVPEDQPTVVSAQRHPATRANTSSMAGDAANVLTSLVMTAYMSSCPSRSLTKPARWRSRSGFRSCW